MKRTSLVLFAWVVAAALAAATPCSGMTFLVQQDRTQQDHSKHQQMEHRGNQGMGFDQQKTTHHFLLRKDGGAVQVTANSTADKSSTEEIQMHLRHIAQAFKSGEFNIPMFVHDQTPPGVKTMKKLKDQIHYKYEPAENGGRVVISSANAEAVTAIHEFLKFQIKEHQTGDAVEVR